MRLNVASLMSGFHTIRVMARTEIELQTRGSVLGFFWLVIEPLFLFAIYSFVFGFILSVRFDYNASDASFSELLFAALIPFSVFQSSVIASSQVLRANKNTLLGSPVSPVVFVLTPTVTSVIAELCGLAALLLWVLISGRMSILLLAMLPILMGARVMLSAAFSLIVSVLVIFIRDFDFLVRMGLTLLFFATPIIYPASLVPDEFKWVFELNPFYYLIEAYRHVLILGQMPDAPFYGVILGIGVLLWLAYRFFNASIERAKEFL
jgi:ABC-type polysaccharide/polyol phosphate export permease